MTKRWFIYYLVDPRSPWDIRYVGATVNVTRRLRNHVREAQKDKHTWKAMWIRSLLQEGVTPRMIVADVKIDPNTTAEFERNHLAWAKLFGHRITNVTKDGQGLKGGPGRWSEERRRAYSERMKGQVPEAASAARRGQPISEAQKKQISERHRGKVVPLEVREKISQSTKGVSKLPEHRANILLAQRRRRDRERQEKEGVKT